jgi:hypothetical protein
VKEASKGGSPLHDKTLLKPLCSYCPPVWKYFQPRLWRIPATSQTARVRPRRGHTAAGMAPPDQHPTRVQTMPAAKSAGK